MAKERHTTLLIAISNKIGVSGIQYNNFIEQMKVYVELGELNATNTLFEKFDLLSTKAILKPGKYDVLKKIAEGSGNIDIKEMIEEAEEDIKAIENTGTDKSQVTEAGPSTSVPPTVKPDFIEERQIASARPQKDVDSSDRLYTKDGEGHGYYDTTGKKGYLLILNSKEDREDKSQVTEAGPSTSVTSPVEQDFWQPKNDNILVRPKKPSTRPQKASARPQKDSDKDVEKLKAFYGKDGLGFKVYDAMLKKNDFTTEQVELCLKEVRRHLNGDGGKRYYCFVCVILSHGNEKGIKTKDGLKSIEEIRSCFSNKNMPNFAGRPKVFFIQACKGNTQQKKHDIDDSDDEKGSEARMNKSEDKSDEIIQFPTDADTLLAYATTKGYKSYRKVNIGSWIFTECMDVFKKFHGKDHLEDMLITVREKVALQWTKVDGTKQLPCVWSTLTKRLMLTKDQTS